ncbi:MAG TPA: hypothetical protein VMW16_00635 [Sedimentisphaerales bacterium]|nr:hypothetical protein [Sedimentisphaerales bacterium]
MKRKILIFSISLVFVFLLSSCSILGKQVEVRSVPDTRQAPQNSSSAKRFKESASEGPTAVESAIELSKKYAQLSEEATGLRLKNQDLVAENRRLKDEAGVLETRLQQTQKELTEANELLREMLIELNNWKTDVIGFREEMRSAEKAQLEALLKILKVLGGEVKTEPAQEGDAAPTAASANEPARR